MWAKSSIICEQTVCHDSQRPKEGELHRVRWLTHDGAEPDFITNSPFHRLPEAERAIWSQRMAGILLGDLLTLTTPQVLESVGKNIIHDHLQLVKEAFALPQAVERQIQWQSYASRTPLDPNEFPQVSAYIALYNACSRMDQAFIVPTR